MSISPRMCAVSGRAAICGYQMTTREMRSNGISNSNAEQGAMETDMQGRAITSRAKDASWVSEGATDNQGVGENTVVSSIPRLGGEGDDPFLGYNLPAEIHRRGPMEGSEPVGLAGPGTMHESARRVVHERGYGRIRTEGA